MVKLVVLESEDIQHEERKCTHRQYDYLRSLMGQNKHEELWLNKLALNGRERLSKLSASKLIDILVKKEKFELRELKKGSHS